jgi:hypothetical protein
LLLNSNFLPRSIVSSWAPNWRTFFFRGGKMFGIGSTGRNVLAGLFVLTALQSGGHAQSSPSFRTIQVDVAPLRANAGDPTAAWVQRELPSALAHALAGRIAPSGGTLVVRIDYLTLGPSTGATVHNNSSPDNIIGVAIVNGAPIPVRATSSYSASPIDQTMIEQSNRERVSQLVQALAYWIGHGAFF